MLRRILGGIAFVFGAAIATWVGYQRFVEHEAFPLAVLVTATSFAVTFIGAGWKWMRGEQAG